MIVFKKLKHNAYKEVSVPRARNLYAQYGLSKNLDVSKYSGDQTVSQNLSKVDAARQVMKEDAEAAQKAAEEKEE